MPPLPSFNVGSNCTVFCVTVNIERGEGGQGRECVLSGGSGQGMVIVTSGMGGPSIFGWIVVVIGLEAKLMLLVSSQCSLV